MLREGFDTSVQQECLEYTGHLDFGQYSEEDISVRSHGLFSPNTPLKDKKETPTVLAHRGTLEAYRTFFSTRVYSRLAGYITPGDNRCSNAPALPGAAWSP